jgi:predicted transposase YdaD
VRAAMFFRTHLPAALAAFFDWPTLVVRPASFIKQSLQQTHSDLLFSVQMRGREVLLYLLFEHQTTVDPTMPLRVLSYVLEILQSHHQRHGPPLPPVLPFILHQGPDEWTVSPCFEEMFELPAEAAPLLLPYLPKFRHALLDLTRLDPDRTEDQDQMRLVLQLMKLARVKRLAEFLEWLSQEMARHGWDVPLPLVQLSYTYTLHADGAIDLDQIARSLETHPHIKEPIMSLAQKLKAEGREEAKAEFDSLAQKLKAEGREEAKAEFDSLAQKVKAEGKAEGIAIGEARAKVGLLERLMEKQPTPESVLDTSSLEELERRYAELDREYGERFKRS